MNYDQLTAEWNGKQVTKYGGECVALISEYEAENNRPIVWGDAHTWINNPVMLPVYDWVVNNPNDANQLPHKGDIVVWGLPNEHIAFFDHNLDSQKFVSFGQNSGGIEAHFQPHSWSNVAGWYTLKPTAPSTAGFQVIETYPAGRQIRLNKQPTNLWGMNFHFDYMKDHPIEVHNQGEVWIVTNKVRHEDGYDYYRREGQVDGFNVLDCDDYTPPPAAPTSFKPAEKLVLKADLLAYSSPGDTMAATTPKTELKAKTAYYVWSREGGATCLSTSNMTNDGLWIDETKNVVVSVVVPPKITETIKAAAAQIPVPALTPVQAWQEAASDLSKHLSLFHTDGSPVYYNSNNSRKLFIEDMTGAIDSKTGEVATTTIPPFTRHIGMVGTVDVIEPDGRKIRYVLPARAYGTHKWYLAPLSNFNLDKKSLGEKTVDVIEGIYHDIRASEHLTEAQERIKASIQGFVNKMKKD